MDEAKLTSFACMGGVFYGLTDEGDAYVLDDGKWINVPECNSRRPKYVKYERFEELQEALLSFCQIVDRIAIKESEWFELGYTERLGERGIGDTLTKHLLFARENAKALIGEE